MEQIEAVFSASLKDAQLSYRSYQLVVRENRDTSNMHGRRYKFFATCVKGLNSALI